MQASPHRFAVVQRRVVGLAGRPEVMPSAWRNAVLACNRPRPAKSWWHTAVLTQQRWWAASSSSGAGTNPAGESDPYKVLGVSKSASADEIKAAYRKLALKWHPDRHPAEKRTAAERNFSAVANAYEVLSNPQARAQHDAGLHQNGGHYPHQGFHGNGGFAYGTNIRTQQDAERLFKEAFGGQSIQDLFGQLFGGSPAFLQTGMTVQVLTDAHSVVQACRECGIDGTHDHLRKRALGRQGHIVKVDHSDQTVKVRIDGAGDVWFGARAVQNLSGAASVNPFDSPFRGFPGTMGAGSGRVVRMKQEMVRRPDGRMAMRITRTIQMPDGSVSNKTSETIVE